MLVKDIVDENYQDYKKPSMFISTSFCDWKCCKESGCKVEVCQNSNTASQKSIEVPDEKIVARYLSNPLTQAIVVGGLEPFLQFDELISLITALRRFTNDDVVIYTGYRETEVEHLICTLSKYENIIIKFDRFIPDDIPVYDEVLEVNLSSRNQYAKRIS